jgi:hypothetical protein
MPTNQPRLSSEDWHSIRHLLDQQSHRLVESFQNHSSSQHILSSRPIPSCQSLIDEKQTFVQLSHLIVQQLDQVHVTDLTVNPALDLISILLNFKNPSVSAHFHYQINASIDRSDSDNQAFDSNAHDFSATGKVLLQASDWKVAIFAQLHHFDDDAQRVYLRDIELRSFISPDRLNLTLHSITSTRAVNASNQADPNYESAMIRNALSDCVSEQLRQLLEVRIDHFVQSQLICDSNNAQCPRALTNSFDRSLNTKSARPTIAFYTHDLEHVLRLNSSTLTAFHNHHNLSALPLDLAQRLTEEQRVPSAAEQLFEQDVRQQLDQQLEQLFNKALLDMHSTDLTDTESIVQPEEEFGAGGVGGVDDAWTSTGNVESGDSEAEEVGSDPLRRSKRQVPCERGQELDEYVDSLFRFASRIVRAMEPFALPNATIDLPEYNMKLFLHHGGATRAYTLTRKRAAWVYCTNESVSLGKKNLCLSN